MLSSAAMASAQLSAATGGGGTALPVADHLVAHFSADSIALSDGANVTSWTDSVNGIVAGTAVGTVPTFSANRLNGKPSVKCLNGGLSVASPGAMQTAIDTKDYTVFMVYRTLASAFLGILFSATAGGDSLFFYADGSNVGRYNGFDVPNAEQAAFSTLGQTAFNTTPSYSASGALQAFYVNGGAASSLPLLAPGSGGNTFTIGSNAGNNFPCNAEIFEILVWDAPLTPAQYMQAEMWARDKYAQAYPWASVAAFNTFFGDSITQGVGASDIAHQAPYLAAQSLGLSFGQWHNVAVGGITTVHMNSLAPTWVDPIAALIGKKHNLIGFEFYNELFLPAYTAADIFNDAQAYVAARKSVANQRVVWGTSTSSSNIDPNAIRGSYDSLIAATIPNANIDSYMAIHADSHIGVDGSYSTYSSSGDGVHLVDATYPYLAALFTAGIEALN